MGIGPFSHWKNCCLYDNLSNNVWNTKSKKRPEAPDKTNFNIIKLEQVNYNVVIWVNYPNCTNYEGNKICVYKNTDFYDFVNIRILDPHFSKDETLSPFARFEPTENGWKMAIQIALMI
jgi:hypothetical protein